MQKRLIIWSNFVWFFLIVLVLSSAVILQLLKPHEFPMLSQELPEPALPKPASEQPAIAYEAIKGSFITLQSRPILPQLPDLKKHLQYFGKNGRPDAVNQQSFLHFAFTGNAQPFAIRSTEPVYIRYDRSKHPSQYVLSEANAPTPLWFTAKDMGTTVQIQVFMKTDTGDLVIEPPARHLFSVQEKEYTKHGGMSWELDGQKVDGMLLAKQKCRWFGKDKFIEKFGGEEFADKAGKQRLDFGEGDGLYSLYVAAGDSAVWKEGRWHAEAPGEATLGKPLLTVKKVDDRLMNLELWEPQGSGKLVLNLVRSMDVWRPEGLENQFKFSSARTRSQFVFEISGERFLLSPDDWIFLSNTGWKVLEDPEEIDDYVERRAVGPLFVFEGVVRKETGQFLSGTLFNASRTEAYEVAIPLIQNVTAQDNSADEAQAEEADPDGHEGDEYAED